MLKVLALIPQNHIPTTCYIIYIKHLKLNIMKPFFFLAFLFTLSVQSQILTLPDPVHRTNTFMDLDANDDPNIEGSKFTSENFAYARLSNNPDFVFGIKYDAFNDDMVVKGKNNTEFLLNKNEGDVTVNFVNGKAFDLANYIDEKNKYLRGFFENLTIKNSNVSLLKQSKIVLLERELAKTGYHTEKPARYHRKKDVYFLKRENQNATIFPKNKKKLINSFSDYKKEISDFIKTNKIKFSSEEYLVKLTSYINDLK